MTVVIFEVLSLSLLIIVARVADVSLGVLRLACVVRGMRGPAVSLGFFEALVWVFAVTKVTNHLDQPVYMVAYAAGFALGNFVGLQIDRRLAFGSQVLRIFTRKGTEVGRALREHGAPVTTFRGEGKDGEIDLLLLKCRRREVRALLALAQSLDERCFAIIDDVLEGHGAGVDSSVKRLRLWPRLLRR